MITEILTSTIVLLVVLYLFARYHKIIFKVTDELSKLRYLIPFGIIMLVSGFTYVHYLEEEYGCERNCEVNQINDLCFREYMNEKNRKECFSENLDMINNICSKECLSNIKVLT